MVRKKLLLQAVLKCILTNIAENKNVTLRWKTLLEPRNLFSLQRFFKRGHRKFFLFVNMVTEILFCYWIWTRRILLFMKVFPEIYFIHEWRRSQFFYSQIWSQQMFLYMKNNATDFHVDKCNHGKFVIKVMNKFYCCGHIMLFFMKSRNQNFFIKYLPRQIPLLISMDMVLRSFESLCTATFACEATLLCR